MTKLGLCVKGKDIAICGGFRLFSCEGESSSPGRSLASLLEAGEGKRARIIKVSR